RVPTKTKLLIQLTILLLCLSPAIHARESKPKISLAVIQESLEKVFQKIEGQTDFVFWYKIDKLKKARKVSIKVKDAELNQVLDEIFKDQPFTYSIIGKTIVITEKRNELSLPVMQASYMPAMTTVNGKVLNDKEEPLEGVTVKIKNKAFATSTDSKGAFTDKCVE